MCRCSCGAIQRRCVVATTTRWAQPVDDPSVCQNGTVTKLEDETSRLVSRVNDVHAARMDNARLLATFVVAIVAGLLAAGLQQASVARFTSVVAVVLFAISFAFAIAIVALARPVVVDYEDILQQQAAESASDEKTLFTLRYAERVARRQEVDRVNRIDRLLWLQTCTALLACAFCVVLLLGGS